MMTRAFRIALTFVCLLSFAHGASAATITFEGFASPGDQVINVNPGSPYSEAGFTLMPTNDESAVFDSTTGAYPGDTTDFFGFRGKQRHHAYWADTVLSCHPSVGSQRAR
jgi:hypothetical protein